MFDKEVFIEDCRAAIKGKDAQAVVRELVARAVGEPSQLMRMIGEPKRAGIETIYKADDLTSLNICWGPRMEFKPHDHRGPSSGSIRGASRTLSSVGPIEALSNMEVKS